MMPEPAAAGDRLYETLLASRPAALPKGVAITSLGAGDLSDDDRKAGAVGNVTIRLKAAVPRSEVQYLVFADADRASAAAKRYAGWFETLAQFHTRLFTVAQPAGTCLMFENSRYVSCVAAIERVLVISGAVLPAGSTARPAGPTGLAGLLLKTAAQHLAAAKAGSETN